MTLEQTWREAERIFGNPIRKTRREMPDRTVLARAVKGTHEEGHHAVVGLRDSFLGIGMIMIPFPPVQFAGIVVEAKGMAHVGRSLVEAYRRGISRQDTPKQG